VLSTAHGTVIEEPDSRGVQEKQKLYAVMEYNENKIDVSKSDQMLPHYSFEGKSIKWWKKLFFCFCDLAIVNASILH
jgi:hypothetical protein